MCFFMQKIQERISCGHIRLVSFVFRKFRDEDKKGCYDEESDNEKRRNKNVA